MKHESLHFTKNIVRQNLASADNVLKGSHDSNALLLLEMKFEGKQERRTCYTDTEKQAS